MLGTRLLQDLESRGHLVRVDDAGRILVSGAQDLSDHDRDAITASKPQLLEILDNPLERTGRAKGRAWLAAIPPVGRALLQVMKHEEICRECSHGADRGCSIGRHLWSQYQARKTR